MSPFVQRIFEDNDLQDGHYVEPYAGGAAVAISLLMLEYASHVHINDISKPVYLFWKTVLEETEVLCKTIRDRRVTVAEWKRQRNILRNFHEHSRASVAFSMFFLNRTNRSGIVHSGGMIGGYKQKGEWKLDARYNKQDLIRRIEAIASYSNRIHISNRDAETFLKNTTPKLPQKTLIFLDPPYFKQGHSLYENHYKDDDHIRLAEVFKKKLSRNWIISYDNHPQIRQAYRGCKKLVYSLPYSAARKYEGSEVMFFSPDLTIPRVKTPMTG